MLNLDTHMLIHALNDSLTNKERKALSGDTWSISSIVLWELFKLHQLKRIDIEINNHDFILCISQIHIWSINLQVFKSLSLLDFKNDPADEIIAATSIAHGIPLVTRDKRIRKSKIVPLIR